MKKLYSLIFISFTVSACTTDWIDRPMYSKFSSKNKKEFTIEAKGGKCDWRICVNDKDHTRWIDEYLEINKMCTNGYEITSKEEGPLQSTINDSRYTTYKGKCK